MNKMSRKERKQLRLNAGGEGETQTVTNQDVAQVTASELLGNTDTVAEAPASENAAPVVDAAPVAPLAVLPNLKLPKAPDNAAVVVAPKGEPTRSQPTKLNYGMNERGVKTAKNNGISNGARLFKVGKGTGRKENTVWGHTLTVAKALAAASADGTFTAQALYDALFQVDWIGAGVTRVKYTPANNVAYAGWIESLVKGSPSKTFGIVVPVAGQDEVSE
jgi:hypothetical protein